MNQSFDQHWHLLDKIKPQNAERVLLTDGNSIIIGSLTIQGDVIHWLFDRSDVDGYKPVYWMELPKFPITSKNEKVLE